MRFARFGSAGQERPLVDAGDGWRDLSNVVDDLTAEFVMDARNYEKLEIEALPRVHETGRLGPPLGRVGKVVCVGLNYRLHVDEAGMDEPIEPVVFLKAADTVVGPYDDVLLPRGSTKTDWEVELAIVIGCEARYLGSAEDAKNHIAGYAISNDVSEREFQLERGGQWDKGKNCETFNPFGPWLVTPEDIPDPHDLELRLWVNGNLRQSSSTAHMIFGVDQLIWYLSQFMVLRPGDVVNTGTPHGVAMGSPSVPYLRTGDVMELEISRLGRQRQRVI